MMLILDCYLTLLRSYKFPHREKFSLSVSSSFLIRVNLLLVSLEFIIISLVFFYLSKELFSGFLQFNGNFVDGRNNRDVAPLSPLC